MTRFLSLVFLFFVIGGLIALGFHGENGYVLLRYGPYEVETSLVFFVLGLIVAVVLIFLILRLLLMGWHLPLRFRGWRRRRRTSRARRGLVTGLMRLWEGLLEEAETALTRDADKAMSPAVNYIAAAQAAHDRYAYDRRDEHLRRAYRHEPSPGRVTLLSQARLEIDQGQLARAQATLKRLGQVAATHPHALALQVRLYRRLEDWERLRELLPALARHGALTAGERDALAREVFIRLLAAAAAREDTSSLDTVWGKVPKDLKGDPDIIHAYAHQLANAGRPDDAAALSAQVLKKQWDPVLALMYGRLQAAAPEKQLTAAEQWLKRYGEKPELLLMAGRVCLRNRLWGRARSYLQKSLETQPTAEAYMALGDLCHQVGEQKEALQAYRSGMRLATATTSHVARDTSGKSMATNF